MPRPAAIVGMVAAALLTSGCGPCPPDVVFGLDRPCSDRPLTLAQQDEDNHPAAVGFPTDQVDDALGGAAHMYVGQSISVRIDSRTAERVQQWNSSDPRAAAVAGSGSLAGVLQGRAVGDTVISATVRYADGSLLEVPLFACGRGSCASVRTLHVVGR
jgi:hypothetical protein